MNVFRALALLLVISPRVKRHPHLPDGAFAKTGMVIAKDWPACYYGNHVEAYVTASFKSDIEIDGAQHEQTEYVPEVKLENVKPRNPQRLVRFNDHNAGKMKCFSLADLLFDIPDESQQIEIRLEFSSKTSALVQRLYAHRGYFRVGEKFPAETPVATILKYSVTLVEDGQYYISGIIVDYPFIEDLRPYVRCHDWGGPLEEVGADSTFQLSHSDTYRVAYYFIPPPHTREKKKQTASDFLFGENQETCKDMRFGYIPQAIGVHTIYDYISAHEGAIEAREISIPALFHGRSTFRDVSITPENET
jgi:hypothetical protein